MVTGIPDAWPSDASGMADPCPSPTPLPSPETKTPGREKHALVVRVACVTHARGVPGGLGEACWT